MYFYLTHREKNHSVLSNNFNPCLYDHALMSCMFILFIQARKNFKFKFDVRNLQKKVVKSI